VGAGKIFLKTPSERVQKIFSETGTSFDKYSLETSKREGER